MTRVDSVRKALVDEDFDVYLVTDVKNVYYLTGFQDISTAALHMTIPREGKATLLVAPLSLEAASSQARDSQVRATALGESMAEKLIEELKTTRPKRVAFDNMHLSTYLALAKNLHETEFSQRAEWVTNQRKVKDANEISLIRRASELTDAGMEAALAAVRPGVREYAIAGQAEYAMRMQGSMGAAFDTIVASGPRSAYPHGLSTDREIRDGDLVTIDLGATWRGYCSDLTRTVVVGASSQRGLRLIQKIKEAHDKALEMIRPNIEASQVDTSVRDILGPSLARYFVHGLGHGVGIDIHEAPTLSQTSKDILEAGNVVTDEPGVYIGGYGGVRIEDTVLVSKKGCDKLTNAPYT